jgi:predicted patatin/cPLA2 family phospholipase
MSDPLSVSASVAGLMSLVIVVVDTTFQYISSVRKAPTVVNSFFVELKQLKTVLMRFYDLTHDINQLLLDNPTKKESFILCAMNIDACKAELEAVQRKFDKLTTAHGASKVLNRLKWPFIEGETLQLIERLQRYGNVFHMALAVDDL